MNMKFLIPILALALSLSACSGASAAEEPTPVSDASSAADTSAAPDSSDAGGTPPGQEGRPQRQDNQILGRITGVTDSEITVELASVGDRPGGQRPDGDREPPAGEEGELPAQNSRPERSGEPGSRPEGGGFDRRGESGGGFPMGALDYTGETATYAVTADTVVHRGSQENGSDLALSDLSEGDVVRLQLDENQEVASIVIMEIPADAGETSVSSN